MRFWGSAAILAALLVGACASSGNDVLRTQDAAAVDQNIIDGRTTRNEVQAKYGTPASVSFANAQNEIWVYRWRRMTSHPENFIPYVGILVASNDVQSKELVILFNEQNVVARHSMRETSGTVRHNLLSSSASSDLTAPPPTLAPAGSSSATAVTSGTSPGPGPRTAATSAVGTPGVGAGLEGGSWSCTAASTRPATASTSTSTRLQPRW